MCRRCSRIDQAVAGEKGPDLVGVALVERDVPRRVDRPVDLGGFGDEGQGGALARAGARLHREVGAGQECLDDRLLLLRRCETDGHMRTLPSTSAIRGIL